MRTKTIPLFTFDELSEQAQPKALEQLWDIHVDYEWWDCIAKDISQFGETSGLGGAYGQEFDIDRRRFLSLVNCSVLFSELLLNEPAMAGYPNLYTKVIQPFLETFTPRERFQLLRLERRDMLGTLSGETSTQRRGRRYDMERWDGGSRSPRVTRLLDKLETAWKDLLRDLEHAYLCMLDAEYEYKTDVEQVKESIRAAEYEFTEDGVLT